MAEEFTLRVGIDGSGAKKGAREVEGSFDRMKTAANGGVRSLDDIRKKSREAGRSFDDLKRQALGASGGFDTLARRAVAMAGAYASFATVKSALTSVVTVTEQFEKASLKTNAVLRATGQASGQTADGIREMSKEIARATLASTQGVETAAQKLLTFRSIAGDTFQRTLELSQDLAEVGFGSIESAAVQLGKALEDPTKGISALTEVGVSFTDAQKDMIKTLVETNRTLEAQDIILDAIAQQVGGAGSAAGGGLTGAVDGLAQSWEELLLAMGDETGAMEKASSFVRTLDRALQGWSSIIQASPQDNMGDLAVKYQKQLLAADALEKRLESMSGSRAEAAQRELAVRRKHLEALREQYNAEAGIFKQSEEQKATAQASATAAAKAAADRASAERAAGRAQEQALREVERANKAAAAVDERRQANLKSTIDDYSLQNDVLRLQIDGQEQAAAWLETEARLRADLGPLYDDSADKIKRLWEEQYRLNDTIRDQKDAAREAERAQEQSARAAIESTRRADDEIKRATPCVEYPEHVQNDPELIAMMENV